jgi:hypothetical protein
MKKDYAIVKTNKKREDKGEKSHTTVEKIADTKGRMKYKIK